MLKVVMTHAICKEGFEILKDKAEIYVAENPDPNNYLDQMKSANALIVRVAKCDKHAIENSPELKVIGKTGVGVDAIDVTEATKRGIPVVITPGANNRSVAEHAVGMMFAISKNFFEGQMETYKGNFNQVRNLRKAFELLDKKVGILGLGAIGSETAAICKSIGMKTAGYDPYLTKEQVEATGCEYYYSLEDLLKDSDFVTLHLPLVPSTENIIDLTQLKLMKKTGVIINCARGGIINEKALVYALENGIIAAAGIDVFDEEPPMTDNPLLTAPNLLYSPHSAAQTQEAVVRMATMCVKGCLAVCRGEKWPHVANPEVYDHEKWK